MRPLVARGLGVFVAVAAVFVIALTAWNNNHAEAIAGEMLVTLNEIRNGDAGAPARYAALARQLQSATDARGPILLAMGLTLAVCAVFSLYLYFTIIRPFHKLEAFSASVASGDFGEPLDMPRHHVFGAFSWAFDSMREGLADAQRAEREARAANKLLIATISHDIKTPVASIRACAEALAGDQARTAERRRRYLETIVRRSEEVARLTDDLFLHAIADMDKLAIEPREISLRSLVFEFASSMDVEIASEVPDVVIVADEKRVLEAFGNIVTNAGKYAPASPVRLSFRLDEPLVYCVFTDSGTTLAGEDVPFIFEEFYRGKNAGAERGSGLGLYIVRHVAQALGGRAFAQRTDEGLAILLGLRIA